jgi:hypothetical protein
MLVTCIQVTSSNLTWDTAILSDIFHGFPYCLQENADFFFLIPWGGMKLSPLGTLATIWPIIPARMIYEDNCGAVGGMRIERGNQSTWRKTAPVPLCPS